jgi:hypothetical protein
MWLSVIGLTVLVISCLRWRFRRREALRRLQEWAVSSGWEIVKWDRQALPFQVAVLSRWPFAPFENEYLLPAACTFHVVVRDAKAGGLMREGWVVFYLGYPKYEMHWKTDWM